MVDAGNATKAPISNLTDGVDYYFTIKTYSTFGQIYSYTGEISAMPPAANYSLNIGNP